MRTRHGFTIMELIVVLIMLAALTSIAAPAFRSLTQEDEMTAATREIETLFRTARDSAIRSGSPVTVWVDSASARVWLISTATDSLGNASGSQTSLKSNDDAPVLTLPQGITLELTKLRGRFRFSVTGAAIADTLVLTSSLEKRVITLDPWTGDVVY